MKQVEIKLRAESPQILYKKLHILSIFKIVALVAVFLSIAVQITLIILNSELGADTLQ